MEKDGKTKEELTEEEQATLDKRQEEAEQADRADEDDACSRMGMGDGSESFDD